MEGWMSKVICDSAESYIFCRRVIFNLPLQTADLGQQGSHEYSKLPIPVAVP
jgi:hypothetical protein